MEKAIKKEKPALAKNIVLRRKAMRLSAHALAERARISYPTLRDIEAGYSAGREETKIAIAKALECSVSDLYEEPSEAPPIPEVGGAVILLSLFQSSPKPIQLIVMALLYKDPSRARSVPAEYAKLLRPLLTILK